MLLTVWSTFSGDGEPVKPQSTCLKTALLFDAGWQLCRSYVDVCMSFSSTTWKCCLTGCAGNARTL